MWKGPPRTLFLPGTMLNKGSKNGYACLVHSKTETSSLSQLSMTSGGRSKYVLCIYEKVAMKPISVYS